MYGNATGLVAPSSCVKVPPGYWAPTGSALPKRCPESGFYCPGADVACEVDGVAVAGVTPGSAPCVLDTGATVRVSVRTSEEEVLARAAHTVHSHTVHPPSPHHPLPLPHSPHRCWCTSSAR